MSSETGTPVPAIRKKPLPKAAEPHKFRKGQSGNPSGRPKKETDVSKLARDNSVKALERLITLMDSDDDRVAIAAATAVLDRGVGKPKQTVDMNATHDHKQHPATEPLSATSEWIAGVLRERAERQTPQPVPN